MDHTLGAASKALLMLGNHLISWSGTKKTQRIFPSKTVKMFLKNDAYTDAILLMSYVCTVCLSCAFIFHFPSHWYLRGFLKEIKVFPFPVCYCDNQFLDILVGNGNTPCVTHCSKPHIAYFGVFVILLPLIDWFWFCGVHYEGHFFSFVI